jgi:hypothetical protein
MSALPYPFAFSAERMGRAQTSNNEVFSLEDAEECCHEDKKSEFTLD